MERPAGKLIPNPSVVSQQTSDGAVLLEMTTGECFELNRVGAEIWEAIARGGVLEDVIVTLEKRYHLPMSMIDADARILINDLLAKGLLKSQ